MFLHDIVDRYKATVPAIGRWYEGMQSAMATRNQLAQQAEKIALQAEKLKGGTVRVNEFISESTVSQKWGYDPQLPGKTVAVDAQLAAKFARLSPEEQAVVKAVFAHGHTMIQTKRDILRAAGITNDEFTATGALDGPYAPLKRFGDHIAVLKSQELVDAEQAGRDAEVERLKADPAHYTVSAFDTPGQAKQFAWANARANGGQFAFTDSFTRAERGASLQRMQADTLKQVLAALGINEDIPTDVRNSIESMVRDMYFQSLDEHHARTSGLRRMNRAGYDQDMVRSFLANARAEAAFLANIKHGQEIAGEFATMQRQAKDGSGHRVNQDVINTVSQHYADSLNVKETPWQDRAVALTSAWQLMTSVGYHVTNAMQGIMVTIPKLGADLNDYPGAWRHLMDGYKVLKATGLRALDLSRVTDTGLRAALQRASDMGVLDVGMDEDLTQFTATRTGLAAVDGASRLARGALHQLRQVSRMVETANRVAAATAAYRMALEKGKSVADAQAYAVKMLQSTQGDFTRVGSPLILKKLPKVVTQYRKYQFMMAALYVNAAQQVRWGSPEEKAIGKRMLAFKLAHTAVASGLLGLPLMNLVSLVFSALGSDDEPADLERSLRGAIGDEFLADMLLRGPLNMVGLDMSAKLGEDKIFSITPYTDWDLTSAQGMRNTIAGFMGPAVAQAGKFADGIGFMAKGEYYKGVEKTMPKGVESAMKAFRIANDGYTLKNGDLMVAPDDINGMALALDALGLQSSALKRMDWLRSQQYEIGEHFQARTKEITRKYTRAKAEGDTEAMNEAREEWMELQAAKDNLRGVFNNSPDALKKQPLSVLLKAPKTAAEREKRLQRAVSLEE